MPLPPAAPVTATAAPAPPPAISLDGAMLDGYPGPVAVIDGENRLLHGNSRFTARLGLLESGTPATLSPTLVRAVARMRAEAPGRATRHSVTLESDQGPVVLDLSLLPLAGAPEGRALLLADDRTMDVHLRQALTDSRARYRDLVNISSDCAWETDAEGRFTMVMPRGLAGRDPRALIGQPAADLLDPEAPAVVLLPFASPTPLTDTELWLRCPDGRSLCYEVSAVPLYDKEGQWAGARGICHDVTQNRRYRQLEAEQRQRNRVFSRITSVFHREANPRDMLQAAASACANGFIATGCQIFSLPPEGARRDGAVQLSATFGNIAPREAADAVIATLLDGPQPRTLIQALDGWTVLAGSAVYGGRVVGLVLLWRTPDRLLWNEGDSALLDQLSGQLAPAIEQSMQHLALLEASRNDPLTGLLNRRGFNEELVRRFNRLQRDARPAALLYVDLDNFKLVNDVHGHARGDEALLHVADILRHNTRPSDMVARLGGDEFAIWLDNADEHVAVGRAQIFLTASQQLAPYSGEAKRPLKLSIGIAVHQAASCETLNDLMGRADAAMYSVKRSGKGNYAMAAS